MDTLVYARVAVQFMASADRAEERQLAVLAFARTPVAAFKKTMSLASEVHAQSRKMACELSQSLTSGESCDHVHLMRLTRVTGLQNHDQSERYQELLRSLAALMAQFQDGHSSSMMTD
jgi:hypothetical protein